ncbi:MAG: tetratricopeptide repeat protein [Lewinellaceae bacterium]|nr:tetratricopeptide repeat protein [Lewinellaceae bacterium]
MEKNWHRPEDRWEIEPLVAFTELLLDRVHLEVPRLVKWLGQWLVFIFNNARVEALYWKAIGLLKNHEEGELEKAILLSNLGAVAWMQGRFTAARDLFHQALDIDERLRDFRSYGT